MFLLLQWSLFQLELYCLGIIISFHYDSTFSGCPRLSFPRTRSSTSLTLLAKEEIVNWTIKRNRSDMTHKSSSLIHGRTHRCTPPHTMSSIMWSITIGILSRDGHQRIAEDNDDYDVGWSLGLPSTHYDGTATQSECPLWDEGRATHKTICIE